MQIKIIMRYRCISFKVAKIKKKIVTMPDAGEDREELDHLYFADWSIK